MWLSASCEVVDAGESLENGLGELFERHFCQLLRIIGEVKDVDVEPDDDRGYLAVYTAGS